MSARFTGTPSLSPRHVCQIYGHTKLVPPACLPDSWAPQDCPLHKTAGFPGTLRLSPARNCRFTGHLNLVPRTKLPVSRAPQDCPPHETASLPGILSLLRSFSWGFGPRDALSDAAGLGCEPSAACSLWVQRVAATPERGVFDTLALQKSLRSASLGGMMQARWACRTATRSRMSDSGAPG